MYYRWNTQTARSDNREKGRIASGCKKYGRSQLAEQFPCLEECPNRPERQEHNIQYTPVDPWRVHYVYRISELPVHSPVNRPGRCNKINTCFRTLLPDSLCHGNCRAYMPAGTSTCNGNFHLPAPSLATLDTIPRVPMVTMRFDPPHDTSGSGIPVDGKILVTTAI